MKDHIINESIATENGILDKWPEGFCDWGEKIARQIIETHIENLKK